MTFQTRKLGDLIQVKHGFAFASQYFTNVGPFMLLTPGNFHETGGFKFRDKQKFYDGPVTDEFVLEPGDLLVAMTEQGEGLLGSAAFVPSGPPCLHNQRLGLVQARQGAAIDLRYVYYLFNSRPVRQQIRASATGAKIRHTAPSRIADVEVPIVSLPEQQRIAEILGAYDNLIEVNRRREALLERIARGLFEEWFVRSSFPGRSEAEPTSVDLGGWRHRTLVDVCAMVRGRSYRSVELVEGGGMPFVNLKCVLRDGGFKASGIKRYSGPFKAQHVVSRGDIVMAVTDMTQERRIVGRVARIPLLAEPESVISMDLVKVVPAPDIDPTFLYAWLRYSDFGVTAAQHANGANVLHLSPSAVGDFPILVPPCEIQEAFGRQMAPLIELAETLAITEGNLAATRDLLLPRLISGQHSVAEAELELAQAA